MKVINELKRVALYIRVSTDRQAKEGDSLEAQEKALNDYAKEHNYIIVDTYIDGGESGQKLKRTNLQRMLKDVEENKIDLVIMTKLDRWFRNVSDFYKVIEILKRNKVDWKTIWEDYDTTTASGEFWLNMSLALGQMEAKRTGERISEIFEHKFKFQKTVCSGNKKYGYDIDKNKKYIINEEEAKNINDLYDYFIETENLRDTAIWFRENKRKIGHASIKIYLKDISYTGRYFREKTGELINNFIPRIISDEKFNKVQKIFDRNIKKQKNGIGEYKNDYIFSGLLHCSKCGSRLAGSSNKSGNKYYRCKKYTFAECTEKKMLNEKKIEEYLLKNIVSLSQKKFESNIVENKNNEIKENNIKKIKSKMNKLTDLYVNDMVDKDYYNIEYTKYKKELEIEESKKVDKTINLKKQQEIKSILNDYLPTAYNKLSPNDKRLLWGRIFNYGIVTIKDKDTFSIDVIID
jgi:DNA invertase Pin-like site-specific DNA recombinase